MANYIIINGTRSTTIKSLLVEELPDFQIPEKNIETYEIGNGILTISDNTYKNTIKTVKCKLKNSNDIDKLSEFLVDCKEVIFSNKLDRYYKAIITNQIDFERVIMDKRSFEIEFNCQPFGYSIDNSIITVLQKNTVVFNSCTMWSEPIITIHGTGNINLFVDDLQVTLKDVSGYITINTPKKRTYKDLTILNNKKAGEFPILNKGGNNITWDGNVTKIEIIPNWRYLI